MKTTVQIPIENEEDGKNLQAMLKAANDPRLSRKNRRAACRVIAGQRSVPLSYTFQPRPCESDRRVKMPTGEIVPFRLGRTFDGTKIQREQCVRGSCLEVKA